MYPFNFMYVLHITVKTTGIYEFKTSFKSHERRTQFHFFFFFEHKANTHFS